MCEPTLQASGWRVQKPRRSSTVAEAAEIASAAPRSFAGALCCEKPLSNRSSTTPSQNAIRNRKNMRPISPAVQTTASACKLAGGVENDVRGSETFFPIIDENTPKIFIQFEEI